MRLFELNGRAVDIGTIEIDGIDRSDYPDFCDAYIASAQYEDGTDLSEDECELLQDTYPGVIYDMIVDNVCASAELNYPD